MDNIIECKDFSYNGYQVVRGEFFAHIKEPSITFNNYKIYVNSACLNKIPHINFVHILVAHIIAAFGDLIKDDTFKEKLGVKSIKEISRSGKERGNGSMGYAEAMLHEYNKRSKLPLQMNKLRKFSIAKSV